MFKSFSKKNTLENYILVVVLVFLFFWFVIQDPNFYHDTYSYLRADLVRSPIYVLFLRGLKFITANHYDTIAVVLQAMACITSVGFVYKKISTLLQLGYLSKIIVFILLIFPFFEPLTIINNLTSEALSYASYLLTVYFGITLLVEEKRKNIWYFLFASTFLILTRGQFIVVPIIFGILFIWKHKKHTLKFSNLKIVIILLAIPLLTTLGEKTYRKVVHGHFITPPYSFISAVTMPLYTAKLSDSTKIKNKIYREIFVTSYKQIDTAGLTSRGTNKTNEEKYLKFHNNFPKICNQNIYVNGKTIFFNKGFPKGVDAIKTEEACKQLTKILIKENKEEYIPLFFTGLFYGFYGKYLFFISALIFVVFLIKSYLNWTLKNGFIIITTSLLLSNALLIAFASHSIMRYLFYNYFLAFLVIVLLLKNTKFTK